MAQLTVWWRSYLPLDIVTDPAQMQRRARYEAHRVHTFWGYPPVKGTLQARWMYAACTGPRRGPDPLVEPLQVVEHDDDAAMPGWATHLMLLITAEVLT